MVLNEPTSRIRSVEQSAVETLETHRRGKERFDHLSSKRAQAKNQRIDPADNLASKDTNLDYNPQSVRIETRQPRMMDVQSEAQGMNPLTDMVD
jgi:hypothetical protein